MQDSLQSSLYEKIVHENMSADEATDVVIHNISDNDILELVRPLVYDRAKRIYRNFTRQLEDRVFDNKPLVMQGRDPETGESRTIEVIIPWHESQKQLLRRAFSLPNGKYVFYEDSTVEDHMMRAQWQHGRADSIQQDADRHERLAQLMKHYGVNRLGDLDIDLWKSIVTEIKEDD